MSKNSINDWRLISDWIYSLFSSALSFSSYISIWMSFCLWVEFGSLLSSLTSLLIVYLFNIISSNFASNFTGGVYFIFLITFSFSKKLYFLELLLNNYKSGKPYLNEAKVLEFPFNFWDCSNKFHLIGLL